MKHATRNAVSRNLVKRAVESYLSAKIRRQTYRFAGIKGHVTRLKKLKMFEV